MSHANRHALDNGHARSPPLTADAAYIAQFGRG
jgi:hypothetical protein